MAWRATSVLRSNGIAFKRAPFWRTWGIRTPLAIMTGVLRNTRLASAGSYWKAVGGGLQLQPIRVPERGRVARRAEGPNAQIREESPGRLQRRPHCQQ